MLISFIRTIILYLLIVVALRIMGKRQVGQLEPTELVVTLMISDLASIPMGHVSIPLMHGVIPILTLIIAEATLSFINLKSRRFRKSCRVHRLFSFETEKCLRRNWSVCV